jgi:hypothetical protein
MSDPDTSLLKPVQLKTAVGTVGEPVDRLTRKKTQQTVWEEILEAFGDPLTELASIAFDKSLDVKTRKDALKELVQYGHSKRRSVEITGADGAPLEVRMQLISSIAEQLAGKK